jgi:hypothetical protein
MYAGEKVENPVAQRTRDVQSWGVLASWQQSIGEPITFSHLARKWAPGTKGYASDIQTIAQRFFDGQCKGEDPQPELVAEARGPTATVHTTASNAAAQPATAAVVSQPETPAPAKNSEVKGNDLSRRAAETARADGSANRAGLGASALATARDLGTTATTAAAPAASAASTTPVKEVAAAPAVTILNPAAPADTTAKASNDAAQAKSAPAKAETAAKAEAAAKTVAPKTEGPTNAPQAKEDTEAKAIETASVAGAAKDAAKAEKKAAPKCRVWTASYGGAKAIIIKAIADQTTNYTVLDVNEGAEKREAEAYISAYAKGGENVGEFASQTQALDKAFELCPEG